MGVAARTHLPYNLMTITFNTTLKGNFRLMVVEERFDRKGSRYIIDEKGNVLVPVDKTGVPTIPLIFAEAEHTS